MNAIEGSALVNIADVVIDVIDLQYHETVMGMGGDLAAQWLNDFADYVPGTTPGSLGEDPFVLVVEGALQDKTQGGAWNDMSDPDRAVVLDRLFRRLRRRASRLRASTCRTWSKRSPSRPPASRSSRSVSALPSVAILAASRRSQLPTGGWTTTMSQTGAMGVGAYLTRPGSTSVGCRRQGHQRPRLPDEPVVVRSDGGPVHGRLRAERYPRHSSARRRTRRTRLLLTPRVASRRSTRFRSTARAARVTSTTRSASTR